MQRVGSSESAATQDGKAIKVQGNEVMVGESWGYELMGQGGIEF